MVQNLFPWELARRELWGEGEEREGHDQRMDESRGLSKIRFPSSHPEFSRNLQNSESLTSPFHFQYNPQTLLISFLTFLFSFLVSFLAPPMLVAELGGWDRMCVCVCARSWEGLPQLSTQGGLLSPAEALPCTYRNVRDSGC